MDDEIDLGVEEVSTLAAEATLKQNKREVEFQLW